MLIMSKLKQSTKKEINWQKFLKYRDMVMPMVLKTGDALKHFESKSLKKVRKVGRVLKTNKDEIGEELAEVLYWSFMISHVMGIDIKKSFDEKMAENTEKFPLDGNKNNIKKPIKK